MCRCAGLHSSVLVSTVYSYLHRLRGSVKISQDYISVTGVDLSPWETDMTIDSSKSLLLPFV